MLDAGSWCVVSRGEGRIEKLVGGGESRYS